MLGGAGPAPAGGAAVPALAELQAVWASAAPPPPLSLGPGGGGGGGGAAPFVVADGLGRGGYACVVSARHVATGLPYALKVVSKAGAGRAKDLARLALELRAMTEVAACPFLVRCHLAFESPAAVFFALDFVGGGDLFFRLEELARDGRGGLAELQARSVLGEVALGIIHLHAHGLVHRDIKVENIMLDGRGRARLVDYGLATECRAATGGGGGGGGGGGAAEPLSPTGSLLYMAPELLQDRLGGRVTDW